MTAPQTAEQTLVAWLGERLDEDEAYVRQMFMEYAPNRLEHWVCPWTGAVDTDSDDVLICNDGPLAYHIVRHDPARVLADVDAKRRIVDLHSGYRRTEDAEWFIDPADPEERECAEYLDDGEEDWRHCRTCGRWDEYPVAVPCATLLALAAPYRNCPGFREEWSA